MRRAGLWLAWTSACTPLPEVQYETPRLQIAPDFDEPICEGSLRALDDHLEDVERGLSQPGQQRTYRLFWMRSGLGELCGEGRGGCFFPATRMMFANSESITHEMTHAVLDSEGESYFLEEGMAELLSGVGVYYDVSRDPSGPGQRLRLPRSEYRAGRFDYRAAAHFMRYVFDQGGIHAVQRIAREIEGQATPAQLEALLEDVLGADLSEIEAAYRRGSHPVYEGLSFERTPALRIRGIDDDPERRGPERLTVFAEASLGCADRETMGPLPDGREGMFQVRRVRIPEHRGAALRVTGSPGTWVDVFDPYAKVGRGEMTDWMWPDPTVDDDGLHLDAGQQVQASLEPGTWAVMLAADGIAEATVTLEVMMVAPVPPPEPPDPNESL